MTAIFRKATSAIRCGAVALLLALLASPVFAQDCEITETVRRLGNCNSDEFRYVDMPNMSKVTGIRLLRNRGNCSCQADEYFIYEERYAVAFRSCRGDFEITGIDAA